MGCSRLEALESDYKVAQHVGARRTCAAVVCRAVSNCLNRSIVP